MTNLETLLKQLSKSPGAAIQVLLPDGNFVPPHFHVTEVGFVRKEFIDCGGTIRSSSACVLHVWVANDLDHRLDTTRQSHIVQLAAPVLKIADLPVEIEYEDGVVSQYPLTAVDMTPSGVTLRLGTKHTACLAPMLCGTVKEPGCCGTSNCC